MNQAERRQTGAARELASPTQPAIVSHTEPGAAVLARLENCLATLDELNWSLPAAHLSLAVDSVRTALGLTRIEDADCADMLPR